jgi:hypothetical protein
LLNISSTAKIDFPFLYWEPLAYGLILYADYTMMIKDSKLLVAAYVGLVTIVFFKYCFFLNSMITQLTKYLGIKLLKVKDVPKKSN